VRTTLGYDIQRLRRSCANGVQSRAINHKIRAMVVNIKLGQLDDPRVVELLTAHVARAREETGRGSAHALDVSGLASADICFWTAWDGDGLLGTAALKRLSASHGEVKSMHTAEAARRRGVGGVLLRHLIEVARGEGMDRLSLETGSWDYFLPARAFYAKHGFTECGPFGEYVDDPNSVFMTLDLRP
jgi:putative acetyltransferase